jgi:hypothetical protein
MNHLILRSLRTASLLIFAALMAIAPPAYAKSKEKIKTAKKEARTWKVLVDHVVKNGDEDPIQGSTARTLGYDSDDVYAKSLGIDADKSKDNREHGIYVIGKLDKSGTLIPEEIVLGAISIKEVGSKKEIDSYRVRMSLDGKIIRGMHATGTVGNVVHEILPNGSKELSSVYKAESSLYLKEIELSQLTK